MRTETEKSLLTQTRETITTFIQAIRLIEMLRDLFEDWC